MAGTEAKLELTRPRRFTAWAMAGLTAYSLLLIVPVLAAAMVLTLKLTLWSLFLPFVAIAVTAGILPLGLGNAHVTRLVRSFCPGAANQPRSFIVQLTLSPRTRRGLWAVIEDADDIGCLNVTETELVYWGDSVKLTLPWDQVRRVSQQNVGLRGLFLYGRVALEVKGLPQVETLEFAERSSWLLWRSRAQTRELYRCLQQAVSPASAGGAGAGPGLGPVHSPGHG